MLSGSNPQQAVDLLTSSGLLQCFACPRHPLTRGPRDEETLGCHASDVFLTASPGGEPAAETASLLRFGQRVTSAVTAILGRVRGTCLDVQLLTKLAMEPGEGKLLTLAAVFVGFAGWKSGPRPDNSYTRSLIRDAFKAWWLVGTGKRYPVQLSLVVVFLVVLVSVAHT
jgi:hypothetical protein